MAEAPIARAARARQREDVFEAAERPTQRAFRVRDGAFVEVPEVGFLEALFGSIIGSGEDVALGARQLAADAGITNETRELLQQEAFDAFASRSENRIQQPLATAIGSVAPETAVSAIPGGAAARFGVEGAIGLLRPQESLTRQLGAGVLQGGAGAFGGAVPGAARTGSRLGGAAVRVPQARGRDPRTVAFMQEAADAGIRFSPAELRDSNFLRIIEDAAGKQLGGSGFVNRRVRLNQAVLNARARAAIGLPEESGSPLGLEDLLEAQASAVDDMSDAARALDNAGIVVDEGDLAALDDVVAQADANIAIDIAEPGASPAPSAIKARKFLESNRSGRDVFRQRANITKALRNRDLDPARREGLMTTLDVLDNIIENGLSGDELFAWQAAKERFRIARVMQDRDLVAEGAGLKLNRTTTTALRDEFVTTRAQVPDLVTDEGRLLVNMLRGMTARGNVPLRSSGTAERSAAMALFGGAGGAAVGAGFDPLLGAGTAAVGIGVPAAVSGGLQSRLGRILSTSPPEVPGVSRAAAASPQLLGTEQITREELEERRRRQGR